MQTHKVPKPLRTISSDRKYTISYLLKISSVKNLVIFNAFFQFKILFCLHFIVTKIFDGYTTFIFCFMENNPFSEYVLNRQILPEN